MARKKKKTHHRKGRRMGATGKGAVMEGIKLGAGVLLGILGSRFLNSSMSSMDGKILGLGEVVVGGAVVVKARHPFVKGFGAGVAGNGGAYALGVKGLNVLPASVGYGPPNTQVNRAITGFRDVPTIGFPKPGNIGRVQPNNMEMARQARMYAGVYN